jgi:hypothetical protein
MKEDPFQYDQDLVRLKDDLVGEFEYLRGTIQVNYKYHPSTAAEKAFKKAALFCSANKIHPVVYMQGAMAALGEAREKFYIPYIGSSKANEAASLRAQMNATPPEAMLEQQKAMLATQIIELRRNYIDVLLDPRLNFYAWFRILASAKPEPQVSKIYLSAAQAELTEDLKNYLISQNLEIERITNNI